ncbi:MAG TPA: MFS transporter [Bacillota bacterium]|nr:MFS transporter [Bacillota bacterium]
MDNVVETRPNVLKNKNFALLFGGVLVSNIAHVLFNFAMSLYVLRLATEAFGEEQAPLYQGYYLLVSGLILVILMPFGGALADRLNKVRTMYLTDYIRGFTILGTGAILYFIDQPVTKLISLFIMAVILGINSAFFGPASASLLKFIVHEDDIHQASSYMNGSSNLQGIIGLILGGILYASFGIYVIFIINGVAYVISAITEMFIRYEKKANGEVTTLKVIFKDIGTGIKYVFNYKPMFYLVLAALFINFFVSPIYENAMPYFINFGLGKETSYLFDGFMSNEVWFSVIAISSSISGIIMALILSTRKPKTSYYKDINGSLSIFVLLFILQAVVMSFYYLELININITLIAMLISMFLIGFLLVAFNVPINVTFQKKIDKDHLGKVQSVMGVLTQALIPLSALLAGVIISKISIVALYVFCAVGILITTALYVTNKNSKMI